MSPHSLHTILGQVRSLAVPEPSAETPDLHLLQRFAQVRDEAAFVQLVRRHGGMVLGVCRRVLRDPHAADDAFQATFLALARRPGAVRKQASLASWLHRVAYRVAQRARYQAGRRQTHERKAPIRVVADPQAELSWREVGEVLDTELKRLPERFRAPLVLCYLEGKTRDETAQLLGWSAGMVKGRLERGREMLRRRLTRRGITLSASLLATLLTQNPAAAVPSALAAQTTGLALAFAAGQTAGSAAAIGLANAVLRDLLLVRLRLAALMVLVGCLALGAGAYLWSRSTKAGAALPAEQARLPAGIPPVRLAQRARLDQTGDPLPPHAVARFGSLRFRHDSTLFTVAVSPDGRFLASTGVGTTATMLLLLWDAETGRTLHRLRLTVSAMAFAPDSKLLASYDDFSMKLRFTDVTTGKPVREFDRRDPTLRRQVTAWAYLAFLPGGKQLLLKHSGDPIIRRLDADTGAEVGLLRLGDPGFTSIALAADGRLLAVGEKGGMVRLWDVQTGAERFALQKHTGDCDTLAFSPEGKTLATGAWDSVVHLWNPSTGQHVRTLEIARAGPKAGNPPVPRAAMPDYAGPVRGVSYAPDGNSLVVTYSHLIVVWDPATGKELRRFPQNSVAALRFLPDGKTLLAGPTARPSYESNTLRFFDATTGQPVRHFDGHESSVVAIAWSPDGTRLATAARPTSEVRQWEVSSGRVVFQEHVHDFNLSALAFSPKGGLMAAGCSPGVVLWDLKTSKQLRTLPGRQPNRRALAFSPDGSKLASGSHDGTVRLWDVAGAKELQNFRVENAAWAIALSPDLKLAASGDQGTNTVHLWDLATGQELRQIPRGNAGTIQLAFSPDGQTLLETGGKGLLILWEVTTGRQLRSTRLPNRRIDVVAWSPDGTRIALAGETPRQAANRAVQALIQVYDVPGDRFLSPLTGHEGSIFALSFSPDSRTLASASGDTTVLLWDISGLGAPILPIPDGENRTDKE